MTVHAFPTRVTLRNGTTVSLHVLQRLWNIEERGGIFVLTDNGGYNVEPKGVVTANDRAFLLENQEEARRLVRYQANNMAWTDTRVHPKRRRR
jgi:hypothetical protein